jgi:hypothetical protein
MLFQSPLKYLKSHFKRQYYSKPSHRLYKIYAKTISKNNDEYEDEDIQSIKRQIEQGANKNHEKSAIEQLNRMFYMDYTLKGVELKELIIGTFKRLYDLKLEVRDKDIYLIVYPTLRREDDETYKEELNTIASILTEWNLKRYILDEFKNLNSIGFKENIEIMLPVQYNP